VSHPRHLPASSLPILAISVPSLSELCGWRLAPPDHGGSALNCLHPSSGHVQHEVRGFHFRRLSRSHFQSNVEADTRAIVLKTIVSNAAIRAQSLSPRALREQNESKQRVLFSISYKRQFFQLLLNHILTNSGEGVSSPGTESSPAAHYSLPTTHHSR